MDNNEDGVERGGGGGSSKAISLYFVDAKSRGGLAYAPTD
jgi:hypothetical protein